MTDIKNIIETIRTINLYCKSMDELAETTARSIIDERNRVEATTKKLINGMHDRYAEYKKKHFDSIMDKVNGLTALLKEDYPPTSAVSSISNNLYANASFEDNEKELHALIDELNRLANELNAVNFDELVPPIVIEPRGTTFAVKEGASGVEEIVNHTAQPRVLTVPKPLPVAKLATAVYTCARKIEICIHQLKAEYDRRFEIAQFDKHVRNYGKNWIAEMEARGKSKVDQRFDELFCNEKAKAIPQSFFTKLAEEGAAYEVDMHAGSSEYKEAINIGDIRLLVEETPTHLNYIKNSPTLNKYLVNGYMPVPLILDLKKCGNILIDTNEDNYSAELIDFVHQLIMQFLVSFPPSRIKFSLIDIDNKVGFSQFKSLTKINNDILCNGIIRDDRLLENSIKDMEQTMYKIDDDSLSYNNVENIYEYNTRFEANPQSVHLFVLINYPSGMRDDTAKRVLKILQNGNRTGIFSIIVNNRSCPEAPGYKASEIAQFLETAEKSCLTICKEGSYFRAKTDLRNKFAPKENIHLASLPRIIDMLKDRAESARQIVIPLSRMFETSDKLAQSPKGIPSSAEVLDIPIGARGGEIQNLLLKTSGDGSAHAVVIGGTGSGKSNLLHAIIMSVCYKYSPEDVNLYIVDFKGGVEFKYYEANKVRENQIPHIKLTGLTSDLEDGVAILNNLHKELRHREDEFRRCRVEDIVQYRALGKKIPRLFVIIDEIQELFEQDDRLGQKAIDILRELFKKGRAFGVNILWASQNVPNAPGLKDKVLSQIGNRISLRLNEPDDALDIKIDPKVVRNLNRPEKGLGVINDIRYGNESIEFRVAYAESSENRQKYSKQIIDKWKNVTQNTYQEPLFIVGDDDEPSPIMGVTNYTKEVSDKDIIPKAFDNYNLEIGQDYVTGKPFRIALPLRENKMNLLMAGYDTDILRDMMGYALLSTLMEHVTNADCTTSDKVYYANGEMINPKNSNDLYNVIRTDFEDILENVSSTEKMTDAVKSLYKLYKERSLTANDSEYAKVYAPTFFVIHSMQRYADLFDENPMLRLNDTVAQKAESEPAIFKSKLDEAMSLFSSAKTAPAPEAEAKPKNKMPDSVFFSDAFKELLDRGGKVGIHFIISTDNPLGISPIKNEMSDIMYKVFIKGVNANAVSQMLGDYKIANSLSNPKVALVAVQDERNKVRTYRYESAQDEGWYKTLCKNYRALRRFES